MFLAVLTFDIKKTLPCFLLDMNPNSIYFIYRILSVPPEEFLADLKLILCLFLFIFFIFRYQERKSKQTLMPELCEKMGKRAGRNDHHTTRVKNRLHQHQG